MHTIYKNFLKSFVAILLIQATAEAKKNVCSMTINSNDEINAMKSKLSPDEFNFVDITDSTSDKWFDEACNKNIQCDVMLISGHFAGMFFGSSKKSLSAKTLEEASCNSKCDGLLKKPQEVYLFGCNTLAGKNSDSRTPEQYFDVLRADGFSVPEAQQAVAFRYSPIGGSFYNRMSNVFIKTPAIYGFDSKSPLGTTNGPKLSKYMSEVASTYSTYLDHVPTEKNSKLLNIFNGSSMTQAVGKGILDPNAISPVCYLSDTNKQTSRVDKIRWIKSALASDNSLDFVLNVNYFLRREENNKAFKGDEKTEIAQIAQNQNLKNKLDDILAKDNHWLLKSKLEIYEFYSHIGWLSKKDYSNKVIELLNLKNENMTNDQMRFTCSMDVEADFKSNDFSSKLWSNTMFRYAISCIIPKNSQLWDFINQSGGF